MGEGGDGVVERSAFELGSPAMEEEERSNGGGGGGVSTMRLTSYAYTTVLLAAVGGLLFGYDIGVIGGCLTLGGFRETMGWPPAIEECGVDRPPEPVQVSFEQGWITSAFMFGCFAASPLAGYCADRFGRWSTVMLGTIIFFVGGALQTGANGVALMIAGRAVSGLSIGILSTVVPLYIAEVSPASLRGSLVTLQQLGITFGILVAFCVNLFVQKVIPRDWGWRISLGGQCVIALFMGVGMLFMPETPRYLAWKGRLEEAKAVLRKLRGSDQESVLLAEVLEIEKEVEEVKTQNSSWAELFSRKLMLTMLVGIFIPTISQFSGINALMLYSATLFDNLCLSGITMTAIVGVVNFVFTFVAVFFSDKGGRKPLLLTGASGMIFGLVAAAAILWTIDPSENKAAANATVFLILFFIANYASTWGAVASWIIPSEVFPIRIRGKAIGLATMGNWSANIIVAFLTPILIRPDVANVSGTFMFYASFLIVAIPFVVCLVPETKGVPLEEMEEKFSKPLGQHVKTCISDLRRRPKKCEALPK
ncbi:MFS general substrate transporter [Chloropicon primus]|nr:MFS general substrate transporter [Chloropicon primus]